MVYNTNISAGNIKVKYNDIPNEEISEFVLNIKNYIEKNFDKISYIRGLIISIRKNKIRDISLHEKTDSNKFFIQTNIIESFKDYNKYITKYEYDYLCSFFIEIDNRFLDRENKDDENEISDIIDPIKNDAKKYNMI